MRKILLLVGLLFLVGCGSNITGNAVADSPMDVFASCVTESGATFFGAYWCSHCNAQKGLFEDSMDFVNYVECSLPKRAGETEVCKQANIQSYPTWEFSDGSRVTGVQSLQTLADKTGCALP
jgi:thiol-disulfide isomerase/thioredoxin